MLCAPTVYWHDEQSTASIVEDVNSMSQHPDHTAHAALTVYRWKRHLSETSRDKC